MRCVKIKLTEAETVKSALSGQGFLAKGYKPLKTKVHLYLPILKKVPGMDTLSMTFQRREKKEGFKEALTKRLNNLELKKIKTSMDILGTIAILEIDKGLRTKQKLIARTLLKTNESIKTVVRKKGEHQGVYRTQDYDYLAGEKTFETIHRENGASFFLDIRNAYFSPRLSTERLRICKQIKKKETVLVMFSGIGAYPLVLAKNTQAKEIYGIEINPDACEYAEKNLQLNKTTNIFLRCGDVREVVPHLGKTFDRILMPLPYEAERYFPLLPSISKKGTIVHYYAIAKEEEFPTQKQKVINAFPKAIIKDVVKCGQPKPRTYRICVDFEL